jgi:hypothetical protein
MTGRKLSIAHRTEISIKEEEKSQRINYAALHNIIIDTAQREF